MVTNIRAVIFDRDDTLVFSDMDAVAAIESRILELAPTVPQHAAGEHWEHWSGAWPRTVDEEPAFWHAFWSDFAASYDLPAETTVQLNDIGDFYHTTFAAFPDAMQCLQTLRAHGLQLAVLTNFELPSVHLTLEHAGLDPSLFNVLLSSTALGLRKPNPEIYVVAADALGLPPEACLFVDDVPENVAAASAVGMYGVLLDRQSVKSLAVGASYQSSTQEHNDAPGGYVTIPDLYALVDLVLDSETF